MKGRSLKAEVGWQKRWLMRFQLNYVSVSVTNILTGRKVTLSEINLSKLNIFIELKVES